MGKGLTAALAARTGGQDRAKRRQLVAWSRPMDAQGTARDCGIIRIDGRAAKATVYMFVPEGHMDMENGDVVRADVQDFALAFISDAPMTVDGGSLSGSRWRDASHDVYLFLSWDPQGDPNQEGELIITDAAFQGIEDRWPVTSSYWSR